MKPNELQKNRRLIFKPEGYTAAELRDCSLADLLFCDMLRELQSHLEPSKFRPKSSNTGKQKESKLTPG